MIRINISIMSNVKTQIVFPEELVKELDRVVPNRERSAFVVQAVTEKLQRLKLERVLDRVAGIWKEHPEVQTDAQVQKYLKNLREADTGRIRKIRKAWHG